MRAKPLIICGLSYVVAISLVLTVHLRSQSGDSVSAPSQPVAAVKPVTEEYFGTRVTDPYRYMENMKDPEVQKWFKGQDDYTRAVLARIPGRPGLLKRITELDQSAPFRVFDVQRLQGEKYFYQKRMANEDIAKLYGREGLEGKEKLLVDPDKFVKEAGTHYSLDYYLPSLDGHYVAYGISPSGSEDAVIHILDVTTGRESSETIDRSWYGGISWMPDNRSFTHIRFPELKPGMDPAERRLKSRVWLHRVGTDAGKDMPVFGYQVDPQIKLEPADSSYIGIDPRSPHVIAYVSHGFDNDLTCFTAPVESVSKGNGSWQKIFDKKEGITNLDVRGDDLYLISHKEDGGAAAGGYGEWETGAAARGVSRRAWRDRRDAIARPGAACGSVELFALAIQCPRVSASQMMSSSGILSCDAQLLGESTERDDAVDRRLSLDDSDGLRSSGSQRTTACNVKLGTKIASGKCAGNHRSIESGRLALPDVLPARARNRLRGMFLCHRLPADGTIFTPHNWTSLFLNKPVARRRERQADRALRRILPALALL